MQSLPPITKPFPFPPPPINEAVRKVRFRQRNQTKTNWAQIKETLPLFVITDFVMMHDMILAGGHLVFGASAQASVR